MKTILIPTDLSNNIEELLKTGIYFSNRLKAKLSLLHIIETIDSVSTTPTYALHEAIEKDYEQNKKIALAKYAEIYRNYKNQLSNNTSLELILEKGDRIANIVATAIKVKPELILLPNEHEGVWDKIFGETNNRIIKEIDVPACIISTNKKFPTFKKLGFLIDYTEQYLTVIKKLTKLAESLKSKLYILLPVKNVDSQTDELIQGFKTEASKLLKEIKHEYLTFDANSYLSSLQNNIGAYNIDLLIVINEDESIFQRWFTQSTTEKLMDKLEIPVLIYPSAK